MGPCEYSEYPFRRLSPVGERGRTEVGPCEYSEYPYRLLYPVGERGRTEVGRCEYSEYPYRLLYPVGERGCAARTSLFGLVGDRHQSHGRRTGPLRTAHYSLVAQRPVACR